ncbi:SLC13 family permease [Marasmitruncus massiliensis]|uniref:SLC13 family permease n=1 Tax=Marasmitruncus massiliensis TaxID=1944642 RepID=UPI000C79F6FC|nr:SLC13 family permease [Marasmitruncus massiliensis]
MSSKKQIIGLMTGIAAALSLYFVPLNGLSHQGQACLALTVMTVILWAFQVAQAGYISGLLLALFVILKVAEPSVVFYSWTGTTMYLIIGAYLIASAVKNSGLGERIAYWFIVRFMHSYRSVIVSIFCMTFVLSIIIPHPWPRAFLIMSVMTEVIQNAKISRRDAISIGFTVFAASVPISTIFLTGDSTINPLVVQYAGVELGWFGWLKIMGLPCAVAAVLTCIAILLVFRPSQPITIDKKAAQKKLADMGRLTKKEFRAIFWLFLAVLLWVTDSLHGIDIGWITLLIAMLMSMPGIGGLLTAKSWGEVPVHVLLFITAAISIGKVGAVTGMNHWIATTLLPSSAPSNLFLFAAFVGLVSIMIHMLLGSVIAVMGVAVPAFLTYTAGMSINPLVPALWALTAIVLHYVFPFQNMSILVGMGEENGLYTQKESIRFSIPLFIIAFFTIAVEVLWWMLLGLI